MYKGEPSEQVIIEDAERVMEFIKKVLLWPSCNIIVVGRSIGSGPACHIASKTPNMGCLALISPFMSIQKVVEDLGTLGKITKFLVKDRFRNID